MGVIADCGKIVPHLALCMRDLGSVNVSHVLFLMSVVDRYSFVLCCPDGFACSQSREQMGVFLENEPFLFSAV